MPRNKVFSKGLAIGIIFLFIGVGVIPSTGTIVEKSLKTITKIPIDIPLPPLMWTENFSTFYLEIPGDPGEGNVYYYVDWGDGTNSGWFGPFYSDEMVAISHVWSDGVIYKIKAKAKNDEGESKCAVYSLTLSSYFKFFGVKIGYVNIIYTFTIYWKGAEYIIFGDFGDGLFHSFGPFDETALFSHAFNSPGRYVLKMIMEDEYMWKSHWFSFEVTISKSKAINNDSLFLKLVAKFSILQKLIDILERYN